MSSRILATITAAILTVTAAACSTPVAPKPLDTPAAAIELTPTAIVLERGATRQMRVVVRDAAGNALEGRAVAWSTDAPTVISVSASGLVTALAPGYAGVTAKVDGRSMSVAVTVPTPEVVAYRNR